MARIKTCPEKFPAGNAVVGDRVYFWKLGQLQQRPKLGRVVEVGLRNEAGQFLNIRVRPSQGRPFVSSSYFGSHRFDRDMVVILEPTRARLRRECAQVVQWIYRDNGRPKYRVRVARLATNGSVPRYRLICTECWGEIFHGIAVTESAELRIEATSCAGFVEGKPEMTDSSTMLRCDCPSGPDPEFAAFMESVEIAKYA
jgi:hypothetical protein